MVMMSAIQIVAILVCLVFLFLLLMYLYLVLNNVKIVKQQKQFATYIETQESSWLQYVLHGAAVTTEMIPKNEGSYRAVETIGSRYFRLAKDVEIHTRISEFTEQYLAARYKKQLRSHLWSVRMNALRYIGMFGLTSLLPECRQLLKGKVSKEERFEIIKLVILYAHASVFEEIVNPKQQMTSSEYKQLFMMLKNKERFALFAQLEGIPPLAQQALIEVFIQLRDPQMLPAAEQLLQSEWEELRIGGLKLLSEMGGVVSLETLEPFVASPSFVERMYAMKCLSAIPFEAAKRFLEQGLHDENWHVRRQAAISLCTSEQGRMYTKWFIKESNDRYAVEMASEILKLKEGNKQ